MKRSDSSIGPENKELTTNSQALSDIRDIYETFNVMPFEFSNSVVANCSPCTNLFSEHRSLLKELQLHLTASSARVQLVLVSCTWCRFLDYAGQMHLPKAHFVVYCRTLRSMYQSLLRYSLSLLMNQC